MFYGANAGTLRVAGILRKNMTKAELVLWSKLKDKKYLNQNFAHNIQLIFLLSTFIVMNISL
jgi:very-short-patch-repair endonuclease